MTIRIFGVKIAISYFFMTALLICIANDKSGIFIPLLFSICLHESSHLLFLCLFGAEIKEISLVPGSVGIIHTELNTKGEKLISLFAGPLSNLLASTVFYLFRFDKLFIINLLLSVLNLLPARGLDGGSIVYHFFEGKLAEDKINQILKLLSLTMFFIVAYIFVVLFLNKNLNYSLLLFSLYLLIPFFMKIT